MDDAKVDLKVRPSKGGWAVFRDGVLTAEVETLALALEAIEQLRKKLSTRSGLVVEMRVPKA